LGVCLSGCGDARYRGKPQPGPEPETAAGAPENSDRQQEFVLLAFSETLRQGDGIDQAEYLHPALLASWSGYGPYPACAPPVLRKLPNPSPGELEAYFRDMRWGSPGRMGPVRAWAILDRPCRPGAEWGKAVAWLVPERGGWRVIRYQNAAAWYAGPR